MRAVLAITGSLALASVSADELRLFGLPVPDRPEPFSPSFLDALEPLQVTNPALSPDGRKLVITVVNSLTPRHTTTALYESIVAGDEWGPPKYIRALHADGYNSSEAAFSADGAYLYFVSNRPPGSPPWNVRMFRARVLADDYEKPQLLTIPTGNAATFYPQLIDPDTLAFTTDALNGVGGGDLYTASLQEDGSFGTPRALDGDFNSAQDDWDLVEDDASTTRLWASARPGGAGKVDIYMSCREPAGAWSSARNVSAVNTESVETAPRFMAGGEVLFFHRVVEGRDRLYWVRWKGCEG
ncbi:hypothetical protein HNQ60_005050 [Povalibacter uvarum]|uniref:WD40-like Beta Propeller Repeat n=1 Tax=Povalibacter uvarum TaxID=732238 RepID=A0A841HV79_9GAMM|nr:PD40 domain-containing protein [Povalibacter uvarum]MBB6096159.1 hypothetical protein [Povalibacter uvarum]